MLATIGTKELKQMILGAVEQIRNKHRYLSELDSATGDGDHGTTILRGMNSLAKLLDETATTGLKDLLYELGWAMLGVDGGSTGPLLGSLLMGMSDATEGKDVLTCQDVAAVFTGGLANVRKQTKAQVGDKTMIDALAPAIDALQQEAEAGPDILTALQKAAEAAEAGAVSTKDLQARFGRAKNLGERTIGHQDPGATSMALHTMADQTGNKIAKDYGIGIPYPKQTFHVKGMDNVDWGMKDRLSRIFNLKSGNTIMLAFDHGYIMGSTAGLERLDLAIPPLIPYIDVLMATRGALRAAIAPNYNKPVALRCSAGSSVLKDDMSSEVIGVNIEDAIRMNASCMAIQTFIGSNGECSSINNLVKTIDAGNRYGIPTLGVVAVGKEMARTTKYFLLATRMLAEFGAQIIKTYYCDEFEKITAACPVPIVIAGGKKLPESDALKMAYNAIQQGASGVDMGRNVFQAESPVAMIQAIRAIVHEGETPEKAFDLYNSLKNA